MSISITSLAAFFMLLLCFVSSGCNVEGKPNREIDPATTDSSDELDASPDSGSDSESDLGSDSEMESTDTRSGVEMGEVPISWPEEDNDLFTAEETARQNYASTPISLSGTLVTRDGDPIVNATIQIEGVTAITDETGGFLFKGLQRRNRTLEASAEGFKPEVLYAHLSLAVSIHSVDLDPIILETESTDKTRFLFGGDVGFGRRFIDPLGTADPLEIPIYSEDALIDTTRPEETTRSTMQYMHQFFLNADYPVVNLESPVTDTPEEYHPNKEFVFFTLPGSLETLLWLKIGYVSLGNNHVYDYLEDGVADTLANLDAVNIAYSGAGLTEEQAFEPHVEVIKESSYSFLSMTSVTGLQNPPLYVAGYDKSTGTHKGGAANLSKTALVADYISQAKLDGHIPIVQLHTGREYSFYPSDYAAGFMTLAVESGAGLVIGHHPHVAHGFSRQNGVLIVESLGNLCFDQARLETMLSMVAMVDMQEDVPRRTLGQPIYIEDYRPRPTVGDLADIFLRRIAEDSAQNGVALIPYNDRGWVADAEEIVVDTQRSVSIEISVPLSGVVVVDLRDIFKAGESLARVQMSDSNSSVQTGRDIMHHGDFEDWDVDEELFEASRWDVSKASRFVCMNEPYRGAASLCSVRSDSNIDDSIVAFRNRIRVMGEEWGLPNKDLTLLGYRRGDNAGVVTLEAKYYASVGEQTFGSEDLFIKEPGDYSWEFFSSDLSMPEEVVDSSSESSATDNPHAVRFFIHHSPPPVGLAVARFDDLALASWDSEENLEGGISFTPSNPIEFLRIRIAPGEHTLQLVLTKRDLAAIAAQRKP